MPAAPTNHGAPHQNHQGFLRLVAYSSLSHKRNMDSLLRQAIGFCTQLEARGIKWRLGLIKKTKKAAQNIRTALK